MAGEQLFSKFVIKGGGKTFTEQSTILIFRQKPIRLIVVNAAVIETYTVKKCTNRSRCAHGIYSLTMILKKNAKYRLFDFIQVKAKAGNTGIGIGLCHRKHLIHYGSESPCRIQNNSLNNFAKVICVFRVTHHEIVDGAVLQTELLRVCLDDFQNVLFLEIILGMQTGKLFVRDRNARAIFCIGFFAAQQLEAYKELCRYYYDTRMFGLVNTSYSNCSLLSRIKGACQVSMPMSYDPIEIIPMTITRCCVASDAERKGEDKGAKKGVSIDESDDGAEKKTKDRMIGRRSIIRYGLYHMSIQINSAMAQRNGVTMDDVNLLIDALQHMFEEDMSSSRALTLRKLFVVEHTKPMGNAYRDTIERALAARLKQPNDAPTSYEDYEVTYHREMLPDEVKVTEYNYNSQSV